MSIKTSPIILILVISIFYIDIFSENALIIGNSSLKNYAPWIESDSLSDKYNYENNWFISLYLPKYEINHRAFHDGFIPLWNSYNEGGLPFYANFESSYFYPLNIVISLFGVESTINWVILCKLFLAGLGFLFLMNYLKIDNKIGLIASLVFMLNGFHHSWLGFSHINSTLLLPWVLIAVLRLLNNKSFYDINGIIFSVIFCLIWLGGHPETSTYLSLGIIILSISFIFINHREYLQSLIIKISVYAMIGFLLASIQIIPFIEYMIHSHKFSTSASNHSSHLPFFSIFNYIFPDLLGNPVSSNFWAWDYGPPYFSFKESTGYVGILPVLLIFSSFQKRHLKSFYFISLLLLIPFVYNIPIISNIIDELPFLGIARASKGIIVISFILSILFAYRIKELFINSDILNNKMLLFISIISIFGFVCGQIFIDNLTDFFSNIFNRNSLDDRVAIFELLNKNIFQLLFISIASAIILIAFNFCISDLSKYLAYGSIFCFQFVDIYYHFGDYSSISNSSSIYPQTELTDYIETNIKSYDRVISLDENIFEGNLNIFYNFNSADGHDALGISRYKNIIKKIKRDYNNSILLGTENIELNTNNLIDILNIKYILTKPSVNLIGYNIVLVSEYYILWENPRDNKFIKFYEDYKISEYPLDDMISQNNVDSTILFEKSNKIYSLSINEKNILPNNEYNIPFNYYWNNIIIDISKINRDGYIFVSENYFPGWYAKIDDKKSEIIEANYFGKAVKVGKNDKRLHMSYRPISFIIGIILSIISSMVLLIIYFMSIKNSYLIKIYNKLT